MLEIKKLIKKCLIFIIFFVILFTFNGFVEAMNWNSFKEHNINKLSNIKSTEEKVLIKYNIAISYANLGKVIKSQNTIDKISNNVNINEFGDIISPYIEKLERDPDNLLNLNYAAFYYLILEKYLKSSQYFIKILDISPRNIWIMNYLAADYIMMEDIQKAEKLLQKAEKIQKNKFTNLLYGYIYYERRNYLKAFSRFSKSGNLINKELFN